MNDAYRALYLRRAVPVFQHGSSYQKLIILRHLNGKVMHRSGKGIDHNRACRARVLPDLRRYIKEGDDDANRRDYLRPDVDRFHIHQSISKSALSTSDSAPPQSTNENSV